MSSELEQSAKIHAHDMAELYGLSAAIRIATRRMNHSKARRFWRYVLIELLKLGGKN